LQDYAKECIESMGRDFDPGIMYGGSESYRWALIPASQIPPLLIKAMPPTPPLLIKAMPPTPPLLIKAMPPTPPLLIKAMPPTPPLPPSPH
jgi:hypothetical protein